MTGTSVCACAGSLITLSLTQLISLSIQQIIESLFDALTHQMTQLIIHLTLVNFDNIIEPVA